VLLALRHRPSEPLTLKIRSNKWKDMMEEGGF
jgi:hypothetical protein